MVTTTGWTLEYIDDMSLCRAIELIGFLQRGRTGHASIEEYETPHEVSPEEQDRQFAFMQSVMGGASVLPPELKDAIKWAEDLKKQHKMN